MAAQHATLGPSSASRWIQCPASVLLSKQVPSSGESSFAAEGTHAHELAELEASRYFGMISEEDFRRRFADWELLGEEGGYDLQEMKEHIVGYVDLLRESMKRYPGSVLLLEQRVQTGIEGCWGTGDAVIVSPHHVEVIDLKYGKGVAVSAVNNPQLRLYGVGALVTFGELLGYPKEVFTTIYQPRVGGTSTERLTPEELLRWRDEVAAPAAAEAFQPGARFGPSASACRFCPVSGQCKPQMERAVSEDFGQDPNLLTEEDLAEILPRVSSIRAWLEAVDAVALDRAYSQSKPIPGYKVVIRGGRRSVTDSAGAIQTLIDEGFNAEDVTDFKVKPLGTLEKLVGKKELPTLLGRFITLSSGKPALVPESAPGVAVNPASQAAADFTEA